MLSVKRQKTRSLIRPTEIPKRFKAVPLGIKKAFIPLDYRFVKAKIPLILITLATVFLLSFWFYLLPEKEGDYDNKIESFEPKLPRENPVKVFVPKQQRTRTPIVKVTRTHLRKKSQKNKGFQIYNQAVMKDKKGDFNQAIHLYKEALKFKNSKIQKNAKAVQQRINYLSHRTQHP